MPHPIPGAHVLCPAHGVESCHGGEPVSVRRPGAAANRTQGRGAGGRRSPAGEPTVTLGPSPGQRGSPADEPTVTLGSTRGSGCSYCHGRVNTTDANGVRAHWLRRCRQDSRPCPALQTSSCALVWLVAQQRAGLLPGKLGGTEVLKASGTERSRNPQEDMKSGKGKTTKGQHAAGGEEGNGVPLPAPRTPVRPTDYGPPAAQSVL